MTSRDDAQDERLTAELMRLCGEAGFLKLVETFGGRRLFLARGPFTGSEHSKAWACLGPEVAERLSKTYGGTYLRVPLARTFRARHYRAVLALSNGEIATRLGITETGVDKLFAAMPQKPVKGAGSQLSLSL